MLDITHPQRVIVTSNRELMPCDQHWESWQEQQLRCVDVEGRAIAYGGGRQKSRVGAYVLFYFKKITSCTSNLWFLCD